MQDQAIKDYPTVYARPSKATMNIDNFVDSPIRGDTLNRLPDPVAGLLPAPRTDRSEDMKTAYDGLSGLDTGGPVYGPANMVRRDSLDLPGFREQPIGSSLFAGLGASIDEPTGAPIEVWEPPTKIAPATWGLLAILGVVGYLLLNGKRKL